MRARDLSGGKELRSAAAKLPGCQAWGALDSSTLASFAGSVDRSFGCGRLNCKSSTRHIVNIQLVFGTDFASATLWVLRHEFGAEDAFRLHVLNHLRHVRRRLAGDNQIEIRRRTIAVHAHAFH